MNEGDTRGQSRMEPGRFARRLSAGAFVLTMLLTTPVLHAQDAELQEILAVYPPSEAARLEALILEERWPDFPTQLLVGKAAEGTAKNVNADLLLATLSAYADRLDRAHQILGAGASVGSLDATEYVISRGVSEDVIRRIVSVQSEDEQVLISMMALGGLVQVGVPPEQAEMLLTHALSQDDGLNLLGIPPQVRRQIREGLPPAEAAAAVRRAMEGSGRSDPRSVEPRTRSDMIERLRRPPSEPPF